MSEAKTEAPKKKPLITPMARLSYPNFFIPRSVQEGGQKMYSCALLFDKAAQATPEFAALKAAATQAVKDKWGDKIPPKLRSPFRDGAEKESEGYGDGVIFINISSKQKPSVVGKNPAEGPIEDESLIYAGCYVKASVRPYAYSQKGNSGVAFGLGNVQKVKDGAPLGSRTRAEDDFQPIDSEEGDSQESADSIF